ncbi:MAG: hypothetical protein NTW25_06445 [Candidatus Kapabacteria bacterium]|nr:hypothetical protein [Candidatus Kapabacteria bacterium]
MIKIVLIIVIFALTQELFGQKVKNDSIPDMSNMKVYYLVLLKAGPNRNQDSLEAANIQKAHIANINRLYEAKLLDMAGPIAAKRDIIGIFIFNCKNEDEVKSNLSTDMAIKSGRLIYEIYPWFTQKASCLR